MNHPFPRWPRYLLASLLCGGLIHGCATNYAVKIDPATAERQMRDALSVPDGRALLMVYSTQAKIGRALSYRVARGFPGNINQELMQYGQGTPDAIYLLPGRYELIIGERGGNPHSIEIELAAGEIQVFRHTSHRPPYLTQVHQDTLFSERELRGSAPSLHRIDSSQILARRADFLNADDVEVYTEDLCIKGIARARWTNAQMENHFEDCVPTSLVIRYDDGATLRSSVETEGGIGVTLSQRYGFFEIFEVLPGMPAARAGISNHQQIIAVDDIVLNRLQNVAEATAAMRGPSGSTVRLRVAPLFNPQQSRVVDVVRAPIPGLFQMKPASPAHLHFPDGSRFRGSVSLSSGQIQPSSGKTVTGSVTAGHVLPMAEPVGIGQLMQPDGHGFLGRFENGRAHGQGYCFSNSGGRACRYNDGVRINDSGIATRDARSVLSSVGNLPPQAAVDMLRQRWIQALMEERWSDFLDRQADLHAVGFDTGDESLFFEARALAATGQPEAAMERLVAYLNLVGSAGASYPDALALYPVLEAPAAAAREARLAALRTAREARMAYCEIDAQTERPACGCREFAAELPGIAVRACDDGA